MSARIGSIAIPSTMEGANRMLRTLLTTLAAVLTLSVLASSAQAASPGWKVIGAPGPTHLESSSSERQTVTGPAFGTFTLTFNGSTTAALASDASSSSVAAALNALPSISTGGGSVSVADNPDAGLFAHSWIVTFDGGPLAGTDVPLMAAAGGATVELTPSGHLGIWMMNVGGAASSGPITLTIGPLPDGIRTAGTPTDPEGLWSCTPTGAGQVTVSCSFPRVVEPGRVPPTVRVPVTVAPSAPANSTVKLEVDGGGTLPDPEGFFEYEMPVTVSSQPAEPGITAWWAGAFDADGRPMTAAGAHPYSAGSFFLWSSRKTPFGKIIPAYNVKDLAVELPPGFTGNPLVTPHCSQRQPTRTPPNEPLDVGDVTECPEEADVGMALPLLNSWDSAAVWTCSVCSVWHNEQPISNVDPKDGYPAEFAFPIISAQARIGAVLRSDGDYGVTADLPNIPISRSVYGGGSFLYGVPPGADGKAFLTMGTNCAGEAQSTPVTKIFVNTWQESAVFDEMSYPAPAVTDCDELEFDPAFSFDPGTEAGASPAGVTADLSVPQEGLLDPEELASPHLKKSVVSLPEGLTLNPSAANGLAACTTAQIGLKGTGFAEPNPIRFDKSDPACPDGSKLGTASIDTPLLEDQIDGTVYLASQGDNPFGSLVGLYIVIDNDRYGIHVKLPGRVDLDPQTGRLTATFDHNPQLPFSNLELRFRGGSRASLATPDVCGDYTTAGSWTPWSAPDSGPPAETEDPFTISGGCAQSKGQRPFALGLDAGSASQAAGEFSPFVLRLTRPDGSQELDQVSATRSAREHQGRPLLPRGSDRASERSYRTWQRGVGAGDAVVSGGLARRHDLGRSRRRLLAVLRGREGLSRRCLPWRAAVAGVRSAGRRRPVRHRRPSRPGRTAGRSLDRPSHRRKRHDPEDPRRRAAAHPRRPRQPRPNPVHHQPNLLPDKADRDQRRRRQRSDHRTRRAVQRCGLLEAPVQAQAHTGVDRPQASHHRQAPRHQSPGQPDRYRRGRHQTRRSPAPEEPRA